MYVLYFLGKCYASFGAPEFILKMPYIPIAIFLSFENPPFDSLHLRETLRQPRIKFCIRNLNFEIFQLQASVVSYTTVEKGPFSMILRLYLPKADGLNKQWIQPPLKRVQ